MDKQIYNYLKKYYLNFNEKKYQKLLTCCETDEDTFNTFQKLWEKEHGGLYRIDNLDETFNPQEILPYYKNNRIMIPNTGSNSKPFHREYIKTLNQLLLQEAAKTSVLNLDFMNNGGGKPEVMIAGLLPIFNNFDISILSYYYDRDKKRHPDVKRIDNKIICISNNKAESIGTKKKCGLIEEINIFFNNYTASSAEQSIICLFGLASKIKINLIGKNSNGLTTVNKYIKLSKMYGIEIPIGYMGTKEKMYKKGIN